MLLTMQASVGGGNGSTLPLPSHPRAFPWCWSHFVTSPPPTPLVPLRLLSSPLPCPPSPPPADRAWKGGGSALSSMDPWGWGCPLQLLHPLELNSPIWALRHSSHMGAATRACRGPPSLGSSPWEPPFVCTKRWLGRYWASPNKAFCSRCRHRLLCPPLCRASLPVWWGGAGQGRATHSALLAPLVWVAAVSVASDCKGISLPRCLLFNSC